jgi:hypothetical protein
MTRPHSESTSDARRYGLGFWLDPTGGAVSLTGYDAGVSFQSRHDPTTELTQTVVSNTPEGAGRVSDLLDAAWPTG